MQYFRSSNDGAQISRISLTGGGAALRGMADTLEEQIGLPTSVIDPMQHLGNRHSSEVALNSRADVSAVSIGLAMGAAA